MSVIMYNLVTIFIGVLHHFSFNNISIIAWWPVLLVFNATFNNVSAITYNMVASFIGVYRHFQQYVNYNW